MPRVRYIDEQSRQGEMDLGRVRVGDLVRFLADFRKLAGPNGALSVRKDEIGEVTALGPEGVRVRAPGLRTAGSDGFSEDVEADVELHCIAILVDGRDDRVGSERIQDHNWNHTASLELWELEMFVQEAQAQQVPVWRRELAAFEFGRRRLVTAARVVAGTSDRAWAVMLAGMDIGTPRTAATHGGVDLEIVNWALSAMAEPFKQQHRRSPRLEIQPDVVWCLKALARDAEFTPLEDEMTLAPDDNGGLAPSMERVPAESPQETTDWKAAGGQIQATLAAVQRIPAEAWRAEVGAAPSQVLPGTSPAELVPDETPPSVEPEGDDGDPTIALPIGLPPGHGRQRVYADPEMKVYHKPTGAEGVVVGGSTGTPDGIVVQLEDGRTAVWDAMDVTVSNGNARKPRVVLMENFDQWKQERTERRTQQRKQKKLTGARSGHENCYQVTHHGAGPDQGSSNHTRGALGVPQRAAAPASGGDRGWGAHRGPQDGERGPAADAGRPARRYARPVLGDEPWASALQCTEVTAAELLEASHA